MSLRTTTVALVLALALAVPAVASAQVTDPTAKQYDSTLQQVQQVSAEQTPDNPAAAQNSGLSNNVGSLPFTGFDLLAMAVAAAAITGTGVVLRRLSRAPTARQ